MHRTSCTKLLLNLAYLIITLLSFECKNARVNYTGYKVIRIYVEDENQIEWVDQIENDFYKYVSRLASISQSASTDYKMAVDWQISSRQNIFSDVTRLLEDRHIPFVSLVDNLQSLIEREQREQLSGQRRKRSKHRIPRNININNNNYNYNNSPDGFRPYNRNNRDPDGSEVSGAFRNEAEERENMGSILDTYPTFGELMDWLQRLETLRPHLLHLQKIGESFENRSILVAQITNGSDNGSKAAVWIDGGIHAREWIATSTTIYFIHKLVLSEDTEVKDLLNKFVFFIAPNINPDGYVYSHETDRMWRKTRSYNRLSTKKGCIGVDANRNFDFQWRKCLSASSQRCWRQARNPCSEIYPGVQPFSEPETRAVSNFIMKESHRLKLYLSLHSYSQAWLLPWGYTNSRPSDFQILNNVSVEAVKSLEKVHHTKFQIGTPWEVIGYMAAGGSFDWAKGVAKIKYSFTMELRDTGHYGFVLPASEITPTGEEAWAGLVTLVRQISTDGCVMGVVGGACDLTN